MLPSNQLLSNNPFPAMNTYSKRRVAVDENELPNNYSTAALLTCICCCVPLGIMSLMKSNEVDTAISEGNITRAKRASIDAKNYAIAALVCGITIFITSITVTIIYYQGYFK
nr:uncharacterized protein LOC100204385 isoform X2 [Hydra vulgaris]